MGGFGGWFTASVGVCWCAQQTVIIMPCPALIDSMKYLPHGHCVPESAWAGIYLYL